MLEKLFKKQEKTQEKVQTEQKLNDKDCKLTDEELEQITGGYWGAVAFDRLALIAQGAPGQGKSYLFTHVDGE